jgi:hypothetical protein
MTPRGKRAFAIVGYGLASIAILSFVAHVAQKVHEGRSLEIYRSARLVEWNYGSALVVIIVAAVVLLAAGIIRLVRWLRNR